jgi:tRNA (guanine-N7-)-methyltransferase
MAGFPGRKPISPTSSSAPFEAIFRRRHFGRRKGPSLSAHQKRLFETLLPRLALTLEPGRDPREYFSPPASFSEVWLEVGFGGGEHLLWQAAAHPEVAIIGAEPYVSGVAKLLSKLAVTETPARGNVRLYMEDARDIIEALPDASLSRVIVLFPDPWPKTRHHKRRFIQMEMLDELARVMKKGAELRFATDENGYLVWALERLMAHPAFVWRARSPSDWRARAPDWPQTRYEAKAVRDGSTCVYLTFLRADR